MKQKSTISSANGQSSQPQCLKNTGRTEYSMATSPTLLPTPTDRDTRMVSPKQKPRDDRYQWPNMFQVIQNVKPDWVIAENVRGLVTWNNGMVLEQVCTDLEGQNYEVQPFIIPACAVNAPHRRDRVWIIAHAKNKRNRAGFREIQGEDGEVPKRNDNAKPCYPDWRRDWREVALATCNARMDDGLSREVDGISYSFAKWRNESIKAYGNAIVPQVAMEIFRAIKMTVELNYTISCK